MAYLSADEFLKRAADERPFRSNPLQRQVRENCLYVARCERKSDVEKLIKRADDRNVELRFEDNIRQPNFAPTVRAFGSDRDLLRFVASLTNSRHGPDEITVKSGYVELWWD